MPVNTKALVEVASILAKEENLRVSVSESFKGGAIAGGAAVIGGLMAGPVGLAVGGTIGSVYAAVSSRGKFKPVLEVLDEMPEAQQIELARKLQLAIENVDATDLISLAILIQGNMSMRQQLLKALISYLRNEMRLTILD